MSCSIIFVPASVCAYFHVKLWSFCFFFYLFSRESKVEDAKQVAKEALAKQVKVSLTFEIEEVSVTFPGS